MKIYQFSILSTSLNYLNTPQKSPGSERELIFVFPNFNPEFKNI